MIENNLHDIMNLLVSKEQQKLKVFSHHETCGYMTTGAPFLVSDDLSVPSSIQYSTHHRSSLPLPPQPPLTSSTPPMPTRRRMSPTLSSSFGAHYQPSPPTPETLTHQTSLKSIPNANNNRIGHPIQSSSGNTNDDFRHHHHHGSPVPPISPAKKQRCSRCKRWRTMDQFENDDPTLPTHAGCLECRESARKYGQSEYGKATRRNYNQTEKAKETRKKYAQSKKGRESRKKYAQTDKAKEVRRKYNQSEKAKETRKKRAFIQSERQQEQGGEKIMDTNGTSDLVPAFIGNLSFDHLQKSNDDIKSMKAFWQTISKTISDESKEQYDEQNNLEVDIGLEYRPTK